MEDTLINMGCAVKSIGTTADGKRRIAGYLVRYGSPQESDLVGDYFTANTYLGSRDGDGADAMIHHGIPLKAGLEPLADVLLEPIKTKRDEVGLWAETVLDMADKYQAKIAEMVDAGKLFWSSGAAAHTVRRKDGQKTGEILRWPITEGSLTPTPCEPRGTDVMSLKALIEAEGAESEATEDEAVPADTPPTFKMTWGDGSRSVSVGGDGTTVTVNGNTLSVASPSPDEKKSLSDILPLLQQFHPSNADEAIKAAEALARVSMPLPWQLAASRAMQQASTERLISKDDIAVKSGRTYSADNWATMDGHCQALASTVDAMRTHLDKHRPDGDTKALEAEIDALEVALMEQALRVSALLTAV